MQSISLSKDLLCVCFLLFGFIVDLLFFFFLLAPLLHLHTLACESTQTKRISKAKMKWLSAACALLLLRGQAAARTPSIDEQFSMHSVEIDDTDNGTVVLKQFLAIDPEIRRSIMIADGPLLGPSGHLEQIIRCDGKKSSENGYAPH